MTKLNNKKRMTTIISWIAVILWMLLIFISSSQIAEESDSLSTGVAEVILEVTEKVVPDVKLNMEGFNHFLRKCAHFFAYLILGVLVINALERSNRLGLKGAILALVICAIYAISDEVHQYFVPGRGPASTDVLIDSAGAVVGICVYGLINRIK